MVPGVSGISWIILFVSLSLYYVSLNYNGIFIEKYYEWGDIAKDFFKIQDAKTFSEFYGSFSRWNFCHPGPFYWYLYALGEVLFYRFVPLVPALGNAHMLMHLLFSTFCLSTGIWILSTVIRKPAFMCLAVALSLWIMGSNLGYLINRWPPAQVPFPLFLAACAAVGILGGQILFLPLFCFGSLVSIHAHVAQPLFTGTLFVILLSGIFFQRELRLNLLQSPYFRMSIVLTLIVIMLLTLPFLFDFGLFIVGKDSNVQCILTYLNAEKVDKPSWELAALYILKFLRPLPVESILVQDGEPMFPYLIAHPAIHLTGLSVLIVNSLIVIRAFGKRSFDGISWLSLTACCLLAATLLWAKMQAGGLHSFNSYFFYAVAALLLLPPAALLSSFRVPAFGVAFILFGFLLFNDIPAHKSPTSPAVRMFAERVEALGWRKKSRKTFFVLNFPHEQWPFAAQLAAMLAQDNRQFYVDDSWRGMFGKGHYFADLWEDWEPPAKLGVWQFTIESPEKVSLRKKATKAYAISERSAFEVSLADDFAPYLVSGFTKGDGNYPMWSLGRRSSIFIPVASADTSFVIRLTLSPLVAPPRLQSQTVILGWAGREKTLQIDKETEIDLNFTAKEASALAADGGALVVFKWPTATTPVALGLTPPDPRLLGCALNKIEIIATSDSQPASR